MGRRHRRSDRSTRRIAVVAVVVAALASLFGAVALAGPGSPGRFGLGPAAATYPPVPVPSLQPLTPTAPVPTAAGLSRTLSPLLSKPGLGDVTGVVMDSASPRTAPPLWERNGSQPMLPASTTKLLTAASVLLTLNPSDRILTRVVPGPTPDSVVLIGSGDPSLTAQHAPQTGLYPEPARIDALADQVRKAVKQPVRTVFTDTSAWSGPPEAAGWDSTNTTDGTVPTMTPLMLDGGRIDPNDQEGQRSPDPAGAAGKALATALGASDVQEGKAAKNAPTLGEVSSPPVASLIEYMLTASDNVTAEALARQVAISREGTPTFDGAAKAVTESLVQAGYDVRGLSLHDGSGLSRDNRIPARLLGSVLASAAAQSASPTDVQYLRPILTGLPVAGGSGTLLDRFTGGSSVAGRGVVRAKTGTLSGASGLAGVTTDVDGRLLVFALMSNGTSPTEARPELDAVAASLSRCGCRG
ncbi:D-alanyl-D-alanine carboxypeptidase/D-alanyl-D-alanine endopeptidase [Pseudonocardia phyllosphaerae]|uniref:D-alanyl-D-alanine carboxypeptidase/D-alanyl-D-alanine endopeptidase n=1 Tax=Pseudonocardia phyllosphaerae TaxID=3390502 RepID=UPI00397C4885